jgi:quinoprotein glucose dehydrogenase
MRRLGRPEIAQFLRDEDPLLGLEAARAINDEGIAEAAPALAALIAEPPATSEALLFRVLNANFRVGASGNAAALAAFAGNSKAAEPLRLEALKLLALWAQPPARDRVAGVFRPLSVRDAAPAAAALRPVLSMLLHTGSPELRLATIEAVSALAMKDSAPELLKLLGDKQVPAKIRGRALETIAAFNDPALAEAVRLALTDNDPSLRVTAASMLSRLDPEASAKQLAAAFPDAAIAEKKAVLLALGGIPGSTAGGALAALLGDLQKGKIPPQVQLELLEAAARHQAPEVQAALQAYQAALPKDDPLAAFRSALVGGDKERGETLFREHAAAACLRCHKISGSGGEAGPDLTGVGAKKDRNYILEAIVLPNAQIAAGFQMMVVTMKNGDIQAGLLQRENDQELVLQIPGAPPVTLKKAEIKSRDNAPSGMPPNMGDLLTKREIRDLVEFVASLKGK